MDVIKVKRWFGESATQAIQRATAATKTEVKGYLYCHGNRHAMDTTDGRRIVVIEPTSIAKGDV